MVDAPAGKFAHEGEVSLVRNVRAGGRPWRGRVKDPPSSENSSLTERAFVFQQIAGRFGPAGAAFNSPVTSRPGAVGGRRRGVKVKTVACCVFESWFNFVNIFKLLNLGGGF
jgi:hypothetical protein